MLLGKQRLQSNRLNETSVMVRQRVGYRVEVCIAHILSLFSRSYQSTEFLKLPLVALKTLALGVLTLNSYLVSAADVLPTGGMVVGGSGNISQGVSANGQPQMLINQSSSQLAINWNTFNIGQNAGVVFQQPSIQSQVLNLVMSANPSYIDGMLQANGQVFLVNPNGIVIGPTARINAAAMVASTMSLSAADFMAGRYFFNRQGPSSAALLNEGLIDVQKGGLVALLGNDITHAGSIQAPGGTVGLLAGDTVSINLNSAHPNLSTMTATAAADDKAHIVNSGTINAAGGNIQLAAYNIGTNSSSIATDMVIDQHGVLSVANNNDNLSVGRITIDGGKNGIVQNTGILNSANQYGIGGSVTVLGEKIGLLSGSAIDASGHDGGGTVLVGGNWQGVGPLSHAKLVYMNTNATIKADAINHGNGGQVVLWSDEYTGFYGNISAQGGTHGGNGGQVETSSHDNLQAWGDVSTIAPLGVNGNWLLDPGDVTIVAGSSGSAANDTAFDSAHNPYQPTAASSTISNGAVNSNLIFGAGVTINTSAGSGGNGDIFVNASISSGGTGQLTLNASRNIVFANSVGINTTYGTLTLNAGLTTTGYIYLPGSNTLSSSDTLTLKAGTGSVRGSVIINNGNLAGFHVNISNGSAGAAGVNGNLVGVVTSATNSHIESGVELSGTTINASIGSGGIVTINGTGIVNTGSLAEARGVTLINSTLQGNGVSITADSGTAVGGPGYNDSAGLMLKGSNVLYGGGFNGLTINSTMRSTTGLSSAGIWFYTGSTNSLYSSANASSVAGGAISITGITTTGGNAIRSSGSTTNIGWSGLSGPVSSLATSQVTIMNVSIFGQDTGSGQSVDLSGIVVKTNQSDLTIGAAGPGLGNLTIPSTFIANGAVMNDLFIGGSNLYGPLTINQAFGGGNGTTGNQVTGQIFIQNGGMYNSAVSASTSNGNININAAIFGTNSTTPQVTTDCTVLICILTGGNVAGSTATVGAMQLTNAAITAQSNGGFLPAGVVLGSKTGIDVVSSPMTVSNGNITVTNNVSGNINWQTNSAINAGTGNITITEGPASPGAGTSNMSLPAITGKNITINNNFTGYGAGTNAISLNGLVNSTGLISIVTRSGDLAINSTVQTTSNALTPKTIILAAGANTSAPSTAGGNVKLASTAKIAAGTLGSITVIYSGSMSGSTGFSTTPNSTGFSIPAGRYTYGITYGDATRAIGSNSVWLQYRERPTATFTLTSTSAIYDGTDFGAGSNSGFSIAGFSQTVSNYSVSPAAFSNGDTPGTAALIGALRFSVGGVTQSQVLNVGTYDVVINNLRPSANFIIALTSPATYTIQPQNLTLALTPVAVSTMYNGQAFGVGSSSGLSLASYSSNINNYTAVGLQGTDTLTSIGLGISGNLLFNGLATAPIHAGTYTQDASQLSATQGGSSNYIISFAPLASTPNYVITPAPLTIAAASGLLLGKTYDGNTGLTAANTSLLQNGASYTFTSAIAGDSSLSVSLNSTGGSYNSAHVASANQATVNGLSIASLSGGSNQSVASDYYLANSSGVALSSLSVNATLTPAPLTIGVAPAAALSKIYDGTTGLTTANTNTLKNASTYTVSGQVAGDGGVGLVFNTSGSTYDSSHVASATSVAINGLSLASVSGGSNLSAASDYYLVDGGGAPIGSLTVNATITPAPLVVAGASGLSLNKVYDSNTGLTTANTNLLQNASSYALTSQIAGDNTLNVSFTNTGGSYNSAHVASANKVTLNGLSMVSLSGGSNQSEMSDYYLANSGGTPLTSLDINATITPAPLTIGIANGLSLSKIYDGTTGLSAANAATLQDANSYVVSGQIAGDSGVSMGFNTSGSVYNSSHVASANNVAVNGLSLTSLTGGSNLSAASDYYLVDGSGAALGSLNVSASITPTPLAIGVANSASLSKVYDATTGLSTANISTLQSGGVYTITGQVAGDSSLNFNLTNSGASYNDSHVAAANTVTVSGINLASVSGGSNQSAASDYYLTDSGGGVLGNLNVNAAITPAPLAVAGASGLVLSKMYDGSAGLTTANTNALQNASSYALTSPIAGDSNLTVTLTNTGGSYNSPHVANANSVTVNGLSIASLSGGSNQSAMSDYYLANSGGAPLTSLNINATITPAPLTVAMANGVSLSKIYDGTTGLSAANAATLQNANSYVVSGQIAGDSGVSMGFNTSGSVYNSSHVASANNVTVNGLSLTSLTGGSNQSAASDYYLVDGSGAVLGSLNVNAAITPAPLAIGASNSALLSKVYDGTTGLSAANVSTLQSGSVYTINGQVAGDSSLSFNLTNSGASYNDSHVATANTVAVSGINLASVSGGSNQSAVSDYYLTNTGGGVLSSLNVNAAITPAPLTVAGASGLLLSKMYDGSAGLTTANTNALQNASSYVLTSQIAGDSNLTVALTNTGGSYNSAHVANANSVAVNGLSIASLSGGSNQSTMSDYYLSNSGGTPLTSLNINATITPAPLTVGMANGVSLSKIYDGTTGLSAANAATLQNANSYVISGQIAGDSGVSMGFNTSGSAYNSAHVASANNVAVNGISLTSLTGGSNQSAASDYYLVDGSGTTLGSLSVNASITPAPLAISASNSAALSKVYDGTTGLSAANASTLQSGGVYTISGQIAGDSNLSFNLTNSGASYNDSHVATANTVAVSGINLASVSGGNNQSTANDYYLTDSGGGVLGSLNVNAAITPAPLTVSTASNLGLGKVYDGTTTLTAANATTVQDANSYAINSQVLGDETLSVSLSNNGGSYNSAHVANANAILVDNLSLTALTGGNNQSLMSDYELVNNTGMAINALNPFALTAQITPAPLTVSVGNGVVLSKPYDGSVGLTATNANVLQNANSYIVSGQIAGDSGVSLNFGNSGASYNSADSAMADKVTINGFALTNVSGGSNQSLASDYYLVDEMGGPISSLTIQASILSAPVMPVTTSPMGSLLAATITPDIFAIKSDDLLGVESNEADSNVGSSDDGSTTSSDSSANEKKKAIRQGRASARTKVFDREILLAPIAITGVKRPLDWSIQRNLREYRAPAVSRSYQVW